MTWQEMRERCLEALDVYRRMPVGVGPAPVHSAWPEMSRSAHKGDYHDEKTRVYNPPSAEMIARADHFTALANATLTEIERKEMWKWAAIKLSRHATIRGWAQKMGLTEHKYRRQIETIFQKLAANGNSNPALLSGPPVDPTLETGDQGIRSERNARHWRSPDAKPQHRPDSREHRNLVRRLLKGQQKRDRGLAP